jgi:hypothetical protein
VNIKASDFKFFAFFEPFFHTELHRVRHPVGASEEYALIRFLPAEFDRFIYECRAVTALSVFDVDE